MTRVTKPGSRTFLGRPTVHQAVDYAVGFALASAAVRSPDRTPMVLSALVVILNTAVLRGPLAAWRWAGVQTHRVMDLLVACAGIVLAVVAPLAVVTKGELVAAALVIGWMSVRFTHVVRETSS